MRTATIIASSAIKHALVFGSPFSLFIVCVSWEASNELLELLCELGGFIIFPVYIYIMKERAVREARIKI